MGANTRISVVTVLAIVVAAISLLGGPPAQAGKVETLKSKCNKGDPDACRKLSDMYGSGKGVTKDEALSLDYLKKALEVLFPRCDDMKKADGYACKSIGEILGAPERTQNDHKKALWAYRRALQYFGNTKCSSGSACYESGMIQKDDLADNDFSGRDAKKCFKKACKTYKDKKSCAEWDHLTGADIPAVSADGKWKVDDAQRIVDKTKHDCEYQCTDTERYCKFQCAYLVFNCQRGVFPRLREDGYPTGKMKALVQCYGPNSPKFFDKTLTMTSCIKQCKACRGEQGIRHWSWKIVGSGKLAFKYKCGGCPQNWQEENPEYDRKRQYCYFRSVNEFYSGCVSGVNAEYPACVKNARMHSHTAAEKKEMLAECKADKVKGLTWCATMKEGFTKRMAAIKKGDKKAYKNALSTYHNLTDASGQSLLIVAAAKGRLDIVKDLVHNYKWEENRPYPRITHWSCEALWVKDKSGRTALDWAIKNRHKDVEKYLRQKGAKTAAEYGKIVFSADSGAYDPAITGVEPLGGPPGTRVTLTGKYLHYDASLLKFMVGKTKVKRIEVKTNKKVIVEIPAKAGSGTVSFKWKKKTIPTSFQFMVYKTPKLTAAKPKFAVVGDTVTLKGNNLEIIKKLTMGGKNIPIASKDSKMITFKVPPKTKSGTLTVTGPGGPASLKKEYEIFYPPTITKAGATGGMLNSEIVLTGKHLDAAKAVFKLGKTKLKVVKEGDKKVTVLISKKARSGRFSVTAKKKTSEISAEFTVYLPPKLTAASPKFAVPGETVKLKGNNLDIITELRIGAKKIPIASKTSKGIVFTVPPGTRTGVLAVEGPGGSAGLKKEYEIFYAPTITKIAPIGGLPGTEIKISGKYLDAKKAQFKLGKTRLKAVSVSDKVTVVTVPKKGKSARVSVTARGKTSESDKDFLVYHAPKLTATIPKSAAPGDTVKLKGQNLETVTELTIGGGKVPIESKTSTQIVFVVPAKAKSGVLAVSAPGGVAQLKKEFVVK